MNIKDLFNNAEWHTIRFAPLWIFKLVAAADGKIDIKEKKALYHITEIADKFSNELIKEVLLDIKENKEEVFEAFAVDQRDSRKGLKKVRAILEKVPFKILNEFKKMLVAIGFYIANASGELYGFKASEEEIEVLSEATHLLGLTAYELKQKPSIEDDINFLAKL